MSEPLYLRNFAHQKVRNLREAINKIYLGEALIYSFESPNSFFIGSIPYQTQVIWHPKNRISLRLAYGGCTYFLWSHIVENLVFTGLVLYKFEIYSYDIFMIFHIFDTIKFCTSIKVDELRDKIEEKLLEAFKSHQYDDIKSNDFLQFQTETYFSLNRNFQKYGICIDEINPFVHIETEI